MLNYVILTSILQICGDIACTALSLFCMASNRSRRIFYLNNSIAFLMLAFGDIYYNYYFRILQHNAKESVNFFVMFPLFAFMLLQTCNFYSLCNQQKKIIISSKNLPYLIFTVMVIGIFLFYFLADKKAPAMVTWYQIGSVCFEMLTWFFALICLTRTRSSSMVFLALGCLMLISADVTMRCLYMLEMNKIATIRWVHIVWTVGVLIMALGFCTNIKNKEFLFCHHDSIQVSCSFWASIASIASCLIGFLFLDFFKITDGAASFNFSLWSLPIALMFIVITSVLFGNWFANIILSPITSFLNNIDAFNSGRRVENIHISTGIYELKKLGDFIISSFNKIATQLDSELKLAAQVAHDIRSPLATLDIGVNLLSTVEENKKNLLKDAVNHIRDIVNNLEQELSANKYDEKIQIIQIATLLEYVTSERRIAFSNKIIKIKQHFQPETYSYFVKVMPSKMRRVLANIINNACEAVVNREGLVNIDLTLHDSCIKICVMDNGDGIKKEIVNNLFTRGFTTKQKGSGLGLCYAKENIEEWGGSISINSYLPNETIVTIKLPSQNAPKWFVSSLSFHDKSHVICVDDSEPVWNGWRERIQSLKASIDLQYCNSKSQLFNLIEKLNSKDKHCTFLIDYEFTNCSYTGIDIINEILALKNPYFRIFLVTSHSNKENIQDYCISNNIYLIPKLFATIIPLRVVKASPEVITIDPHKKELEC